MAEFLSTDWLQELDAALASAGEPPIDRRLVIEQQVTSASGDFTYRIVLDPAAARVTTDTDGDATVRFRQSRAVATAIASGRTSAHEAFILGQLEVTGDTRALVRQSEVTAWLDAAMASVRDSTTW